MLLTLTLSSIVIMAAAVDVDGGGCVSMSLAGLFFFVSEAKRLVYDER